MASDLAHRPPSSSGELEALIFVGLADSSGSVPGIFRLLGMGNATQDFSSSVEWSIDDLKVQIKRHYEKVVLVDQSGAGQWSIRKDAVMKKLESKSAADNERFSKALLILQQSEHDHKYDKNLQEAFEAILD